MNVIWEMKIRRASRALADGGARRDRAIARAVVAALAVFDRLFVLEGKYPVKVNRRAYGTVELRASAFRRDAFVESLVGAAVVERPERFDGICGGSRGRHHARTVVGRVHGVIR